MEDEVLCWTATLQWWRGWDGSLSVRPSQRIWCRERRIVPVGGMVRPLFWVKSAVLTRREPYCWQWSAVAPISCCGICWLKQNQRTKFTQNYWAFSKNLTVWNCQRRCGDFVLVHGFISQRSQYLPCCRFQDQTWNSQTISMRMWKSDVYMYLRLCFVEWANYKVLYHRSVPVSQLDTSQYCYPCYEHGKEPPKCNQTKLVIWTSNFIIFIFPDSQNVAIN